jgi:hypothetical protein
MAQADTVYHSLPAASVPTSRVVPLPLIYLMIGIAGALLRIRLYMSLGATSLTRDEAALALNFVGGGFLRLLQPLGYDQAAPIGFLLAEKSLLATFGESELAWRLLPFATSILILPLFYFLIRDVLSPCGIIVGMTMIALSEPLVWFGVFFKQYSFDVMVALILLIAGRWALRDESRHARYLVVGTLGALAVWFSFPSIFVTGGIGVTLIGHALLRGQRREALNWTLAMSLSALSFAVGYLISFRHYAGNHGLQAWWVDSFAPMPPRSMKDLKWYGDNLLALFPDEIGVREAGLACAMLLFGVYNLARDRDRRVMVALFLAPIGLTLIASAVHKYPFGNRTMLFANPSLIALVACGVAAVWNLREPKARALTLIIIGVLFLYPLYLDLKYLINPYDRVFQDVKPVIAYIADHRQKGDALYVHWDAETLHDFYCKKLDFRKTADWPAVVSRDPGKAVRSQRLASYAGFLDQLGSSGHVWVFLGIAGKPEEELVVELLDRRGRKLDEFHGIGFAAYRYELSPPVPANGVPEPINASSIEQGY